MFNIVQKKIAALHNTAVHRKLSRYKNMYVLHIILYTIILKYTIDTYLYTT